MNKKELILAGLAPAKGDSHSPVQVQKLFFLIEKNIAEFYEGPLFDFQPYNYGPYEKEVYQVLEQLEEEGLVDIDYEYKWRKYRLTIKGQKEGDKLLKTLPQIAQTFVADASKFVKSLSFAQLVSAIYKAYPDMKANSVFQG